jgi:phosphopantothenoylcysteine decarboxylase/phosphopantothenate--cysteine ligase
MSDLLSQRRVILGVTAGIAAYKAAELLRMLRQEGAEVRVVMTSAATAFIGPLTLQALSAHPVRTDLLDPQSEQAMDHITLARWAEAVLVAPASADFMARLAHGHANDLLSTLCLATTAPVALAPAMNHVMWHHRATQANVRRLVDHGVQLWGPASGSQACGEVGEGRMREPTDLLADLARLFSQGALSGVRVLVTAGPTREAIDPVRVITNRSSGKMGYAIAEAAAAAGATVTLVSGPVALEVPPRVTRLWVETAEQMAEAVAANVADQDIVIAAAAVADYRPANAHEQKIKKQAERLQLELVRNRDVLAEIGRRQSPPFLVGFAAETHDLEFNARAKLVGKSLDMVAANWVGGPESALEGDDNALLVLWHDGERQLPRMSKRDLARELLNLIAERYDEKKGATQSH